MGDDILNRYLDQNFAGMPGPLREKLLAWLKSVRESLASQSMDPDAVVSDLVRHFEETGQGPFVDLADQDMRRDLELLAGHLRAPRKEEAPAPETLGPLKDLGAKVKAARLKTLGAIAATAGALGIAGEDAFAALMDDLSEGAEDKPPGEKPPEKPPAEKPGPEPPAAEPPDLVKLKAKVKDAIKDAREKTLRYAEELSMDTGELSNLFQELEGGAAAPPAQAPAAQAPPSPATPSAPQAPAAEAPAAPSAAAPESAAMLVAAKGRLLNALGETKGMISILADDLDLDRKDIDDLLKEL